MTPDIDTELAGRPGLLRDACERALAYLAGVGSRPVAPPAAAIAALDGLDFELPGAGLDSGEVLRLLDDLGSPATMASGGPRYFGFVTGAALPVAQAAAWLGAAWDQNGGLAVMSPAGARLHRVALRWVATLLGLPAGTAAAFTTGATMANTTCLAAARDAVLTRHGWDAAADGLVGAPPVTVLAGEQAHPSLGRAVGLTGLGRGRTVPLPADDQGAIVPRGLPSLDGPAIVCLQAGNVNTGASDPFAPLIEWAHEHGAWVHVDGAFGLWAAASPLLAGQVAGVAGADSWATDAHKWLNTTYDSGIALVADAAALRATMRASASYLVSEGDEAMLLSPEMSQRVRGIEAWAVLAALGRDGVASLVDRACALARRFAGGMRAGGHRVLNDVVLNQVLVDFGEPEKTSRVIAAVQADGTCWCGPASWRGSPAMRFSVSAWHTTEADIDASIAAVIACAG
jgi:glutamate/tyrosine decarboxylase-like PLP-dependent enzyme